MSKRKRSLIPDFEARSVALLAAYVLVPFAAATHAPASATLRSALGDRHGQLSARDPRDAAATVSPWVQPRVYPQKP